MANESEKILRRQWRTEQKFFDVLNKEFKFQLDAAASAENAKCGFYYTEEDDALSDKCPWVTEHCRNSQPKTRKALVGAQQGGRRHGARCKK